MSQSPVTAGRLKPNLAPAWWVVVGAGGVWGLLGRTSHARPLLELPMVGCHQKGAHPFPPPWILHLGGPLPMTLDEVIFRRLKNSWNMGTHCPLAVVRNPAITKSPSRASLPGDERQRVRCPTAPANNLPAPDTGVRPAHQLTVRVSHPAESCDK